ncbi:MAG: type II toxin-antitoxin system RelE/ParE family toxin [Candidatus Accumulibacter sp.]|jgi:putative addiction module killer protein|nr:type II toxin-antitoxin system RelE/ParE family toxin [Accumulibacter sp.]
MNTIETTPSFDAWYSALRDPQVVWRVNARIFRAGQGNFGDAKPVGEGVFEMRIHYGPGIRVYFKQTGRTIYLLLAGGDKSTQSADIKAAQDIARQLQDKDD